QIREAISSGPFSDPRWLRAVLEIAMHALPAAYRDGEAPAGASVAVNVTGRSGGAWIVKNDDGGWTVEEGTQSDATAEVTLSDQTAWRLLFSGRSRQHFVSLVKIEGDRALAAPLLRARAIVI